METIHSNSTMLPPRAEARTNKPGQARNAQESAEERIAKHREESHNNERAIDEL